MQALILAGGFGSRLMPVVNDRPKIMADVHGRPFLEILILNLKRNGIKDIILALGYLSEYVKNYFHNGKSLGVNIRYSVENLPLGTAGAIKNAESLLRNPFLLLNGDTFMDVNFQVIEKFHKERYADITIVLSNVAKMQDRGVVSIDKNDRIISFREIEDNEKVKEYFTNAGVYLMNKKLCKYIKKDEKVSLEKVLLPKILKKLNIFGFAVDKEFYDIGTPQRYRFALDVLKSSS